MEEVFGRPRGRTIMLVYDFHLGCYTDILQIPRGRTEPSADLR